MKNLLIVESPGKVKKIQGYLGNDWKVAASVGHVRDLPANEMAIDLENGFKPDYRLTSRGKDVVSRLRKLVSQSDHVYLATDPDREGEAIAWHLKVVLKLKSYHRVTFTEISKTKIQAAIQNPRRLDMSLVSAQEARRVLDRIVGYRVSPVLSDVLSRKGISAGRVQSPALGLVVKREQEINSFVPVDYFDVYMTFSSSSGEWLAKWDPESLLGDSSHCTDRQLAEAVSSLRDFCVDSYEEGTRKRHPHPPFTTSTLQQAASAVLKFSPKTTMSLAQKLYEMGLITYMRTDSPNMSDAAVMAARDWLSSNGFEAEINPVPPVWKAKDGAQEGHEAIRPVDFKVRQVQVPGDKDERDLQSLYSLIYERSVCCQMKPAEYLFKSSVLVTTLSGKEIRFSARSRKLAYPGWLKLFRSKATDPEADHEDENMNMPVLVVGGDIEALSGSVDACKTKPPKRYTEASLIKVLDSLGIGRPSTYAAILQGLRTRSYIEVKRQKLHASELGALVYGSLRSCSFSGTDFTGQIEERLDAISQGKDSFVAVVSSVNSTLDTEIISLKAKNKERS